MRSSTPARSSQLTADGDSGMLAGHGMVEGTHAVAFASDATVMGGAMGAEGCKVILAAYARALADDVPIVGLWHSGGARLAEGVVSLHAVGEVFNIMTRASGRIPQISVVLGAAAGGAAYGPALTDIVILGPQGRVFVTGPDVVRSVTGEDVDMERLGGPNLTAAAAASCTSPPRPTMRPSTKARAAHACCSARKASWKATTEVIDVDLAGPLPESDKRAYDVHPLVEAACSTRAPASSCTSGGRRTSSRRWAASAAAQSASSPTTRCASAAASTHHRPRRRPASCGCATRSASRWSCVVDVPGYLPGVGQEWDGVVRRGAKLLHAFAEAVVPRVTVVTRKAYGGAYIAMNSRALGATACLPGRTPRSP